MSEFEEGLEYYISGEGRTDIDNLINLRNRSLINPADLRISLSELVIFDMENMTLHYSPDRDFDGGKDIAYTLCSDHNGRLSRELDVWLILDNWINYSESNLEEVYTFLEDHDVDPKLVSYLIATRIEDIYSKQRNDV